MIDRYGSLLDAAAVAANLGWPIKSILGLSDPVEIMATIEVINRAEKIRAKHEKSLLDQLETIVRNGVAKAFSKSS